MYFFIFFFVTKAERIIGTWKANKTQMNQDEPRTALMSNVKQVKIKLFYLFFYFLMLIE